MWTYEDSLGQSKTRYTEPQQAETCLQEGKADVIFLAPELLRTPDWPLRAAEELGVAITPANQYERAWADLLRPRAPAA